MKKLISALALVSVLALAFTGCASKSGKAADAPVSVHPRTYHIDLADGAEGPVVDIVYNQYGPNYQGTREFGNWVKTDKPKAGDTVIVHYKGVSDIDLPVLALGLVDTSAAASYWTNLLDPSIVFLATDVKAGVPFEGTLEFVLATDVKSKFGVYLQYDSTDTTDFPIVGKAAKITFEKVGETTDTSLEVPDTTPKGPQTFNIAIDKVAAFCEIGTNHPWIDGVQDMSVISNYETTVSIQTVLPDEYALKAGDTLNITWEATPDRDIEKIFIRPVDKSPEVGWWKELVNSPSDANAWLLAENLKGGEKFSLSKTIKIEIDGYGPNNVLCIWYDYDPETNGPGPSLILAR